MYKCYDGIINNLAATTDEPSSTYFGDKKALRRWLREARGSATLKHRREWSARISEHVLSLPAITDADTVFCYVSIGDEVDTREIINRLAASKKHIWLPRIAAGYMQALPFEGWEALTPGQLAIPEPSSSSPEGVRFDVTLTPGLGFSTVGERIGYGAGHYDHWFRNHNGGVRVGLAFSLLILDSLPTANNDVGMNVVISEEGVIAIR